MADSASQAGSQSRAFVHKIFLSIFRGHGYEAESDRLFGEDVFAAELEDFEYTNAFLLGSDIGAIATDEDADIVRALRGKHQITAPEIGELDRDDLHQREALRFQLQLMAFEKGFNSGRQRQTGDESSLVS